eukprot:SAG31_NODE_718_length_12607_cov_21.723937_3_plen_55_part_00
MSTGDALDNSIVFIDVSIDGGTPQRMVFEVCRPLQAFNGSEGRGKGRDKGGSKF